MKSINRQAGNDSARVDATIQTVERPDREILSELNHFLLSAPDDSGVCPEHDPRWLDVLRDGFSHRTFMLIARSSVLNGPTTSESDHHSQARRLHRGAICGYLPLTLVSSRLFGRFLVSLPYVNRAGVVAEDQSIRISLVEQAIELARQHDVKYLELRSHQTADQRLDHHPKFQVGRSNKVRMVLPLPDTATTLWQSVGAKVRNQIRKGDKSQLTIRWGRLDLLDDFYSIFAINMRDLGTPVYPKKLFAAMMQHFDDQVELATVTYQGQPVAAAVLSHSRHETQVPSASSLRAFSHTNANMWMYHRLLLRAIERGSRSFDFGRSSQDSGTYRFKKQWGSQPQPTRWYYHLRYGDMMAMRPDSPRNRRRVAVWKKLPVWLTQQVGPMIVRGIP